MSTTWPSGSQRAAALIRLCRGRIASARLEIETVVADLERVTRDDRPEPD